LINVLIEILIQLNGELSEELDDKGLKARFVRNVEIIKDLMLEMTSRISLQYPELAVSAEMGLCTENRLNGVFEAMKFIDYRRFPIYMIILFI